MPFYLGRVKRRFAAAALPALCATLLCILFASGALPAEQVAVRYPEGTTRGFLIVRSPKDAAGSSPDTQKEIGTGDLTETVSGDHVESTLTFHFKDGSFYEEVAAFSQEGKFRLLRYRLTEKGPSFKQPVEMSVDPAQGLVVVHYSDDHGRAKVNAKHMALPADLADGIVPVLAKNLPAEGAGATVSMVVATPKPRLVNLTITPQGSDAVSFGGSKFDATRFDIKAHAGGVTGAAAKISGKQPPDTLIWILRGPPPAFIGSLLPIYNGPTCEIEMGAPGLPASQK